MQPEEFLTGLVTQTEAPAPAPPKTSKNDIYHNLTANQVFNDLDDYIVNVSICSSRVGFGYSNLADQRIKYTFETG